MFFIFCIALCGVLFKEYLDGKFDSVETLQQYIVGFGLLAPVVLVTVPALQVVLPVLPGVVFRLTVHVFFFVLLLLGLSSDQSIATDI